MSEHDYNERIKYITNDEKEITIFLQETYDGNGTGNCIYFHNDEMEAYDNLPEKYRKFLANLEIMYSAEGIFEFLCDFDGSFKKGRAN